MTTCRTAALALMSAACTLLASCGGGEETAAPEAAARMPARLAAPLAPASGRWSDIVPLSLTPMAVANLPNGKVMMWSGRGNMSFGTYGGRTQTAVFDPLLERDSGAATVQVTGHEFFCPGTTLMPDGRVYITGGSDPAKTSFYDANTGAWSAGDVLSIPRAYHAQTLLADGGIFTYGGSWNGGVGNKHGELWTATGGWRRLPGVPILASAMGPDPRGTYRADNHMWLIPTGNGRVLHAGPSADMHWIDTQGDGSIVPAGPRGDDAYAQSGNTVMYEAGKILKVGGAPAYDNGTATRRSYVIDTNAGLSVRRVADLVYPRVFSNAVVLPDGQVFVVGGQTTGASWTDTNSVLAPEIFDPVTESFTVVAPMKRGRNYHSVALLLPDARVFVGGQGGCGGTGPGCDEHSDAEIFSPHYLYTAGGELAPRPSITSAPAEAVHGSTLAVRTDKTVSAFSLVRLSATTHTVNNDQRRLSLSFTAASSNDYSVRLPDNPGLLLPGHYMLFALDAYGVPSVAHTLRVGNAGAPMLRNPGDQASAAGTAARVAVSLASGVSAAGVSYSATALPPGVSIDPTTGVISGTPTTPGRHAVTLTARNALTSSSTQIVWTVTGEAIVVPQPVSWVRLEAASEINGKAWASMAEFNLLGADGRTLPRVGWQVSASSEEAPGGRAALAIDGDPATAWHTQFSAAVARPPHSFTVQLPSPQVVTGLRYLPRQDGVPNGTINDWRAYTSVDGINWTRVGSGSLSTYADWPARQAGGYRQATWVRLEALTEVNGNPWASMAEFNLMGPRGALLPRTGWTVEASSEEPNGGQATLALDGNVATNWHTAYSNGTSPPPHTFTVRLPATQSITGFRYLPRQDGVPNGRLRAWRFWTSLDGVTWQAAGEGNFSLSDDGAAERVQWLDERIEYFHEVAVGRRATQSSTWAGVGYDASVAVDGIIMGSSTHTANPPQAAEWWQVDLGALRSLTAVRLWNRRDCCSTRLANFHVFVSSQDMTGRSLDALLADPAVWRSTHPAAAPVDQLTLPARTTGRYVRVQLAGTNFLSLQEVQVFAQTQELGGEPVVSAPADASVFAGEPALVAVSGSSPDGTPVTFSATGLPAGLNLGASTGLITGTPTSLGVSTVAVTATTAKGATARTTMTLRVVARPIVVAPVQAPAVISGGTASYTLQGNFPAGSSWVWDFGDGTSPVSTSTAAVTHPFSSPGVYTVTVRIQSPGGTMTSFSFLQAVSLAATAAAPTASSQFAWQPRSGATPLLWVVNPDNNTVSVMDPVAGSRLAEVAVGATPRTVARSPRNGRMWVVNGTSATLSLVDPDTRSVVATVRLPRASRPHGLVFAPDGSAAYVALEATGQVLRLDPTTGATLATVTVGPDVRHLAVAGDRPRLLVSRFITPPQPGENTLSVSGTNAGGEVLVLDSVTLARVGTTLLRHSVRPDSETQGRGVPNYLGAPAISPDGRTAWVPSKQDNIMRGTARDPNRLNLDFQNTVRAISSRIDMATLTEVTTARVDHDNASLASAASFHPNGAYLFVALETSREVAVVDAHRGLELFRFEVGLAPQAVTVSPDGLRLAVHHFMDRSVGLYELGPLVNAGESRVPVAATVRSIGTERLPAEVLKGKQFFYDARDPRLARLGYMSCASCHNDGGHDGRTWDFTGFGEGLRNTPSLRGRAGMANGPLHWSGNFDEVQDFEGQIRNLAGGTGLMQDADFLAGTRRQPLGDAKAGLSADLDALAAYVASLNSPEPSPHRSVTGALSVDALAGRAVFGARCASCHRGEGFSDSALHALRQVGTLKPASGQRLGATLTGIDVPGLRGAWATAPYLHDGSAATIEDAVRAHRGIALSATELTQVSAFVRQLGSEEGVAENWMRCAAEGGNCSFTGTRTVRYGLGSTWVTRSLTGGTACNNAVFGDPLVGKGKVCELAPVSEWTTCAAELGTCTVTGTQWVRYGAQGVWTTPRAMSGSFSCSNGVFGDALYGVVKMCQVRPVAPAAAPIEVNAASARTAAQSSTYSADFGAAIALDGVAGPGLDAWNFTHTAGQAQANEWWQTDLGSSVPITGIRLWNRIDCCGARLANFVVFISANDMSGRSMASLLQDPAVWRLTVPDTVGTDLAIAIPGVSGRHVRVQMAGGPQILSLQEVEVLRRR